MAKKTKKVSKGKAFSKKQTKAQKANIRGARKQVAKLGGVSDG